MKDHSTSSQPGSYQPKLTSGQLHKEEAYWTKKLAGELVTSSFPYDREKTKAQKKMETFKFQFPQDLATRLIQMSNKSDYRLQMTLAAGLVVLLDKYTGNKDIILGTPTLKQDFEADFINTVLPLRSQTGKEDMTFKDLLLQVKQTVIEANEHQNYPIEQLVHQLGMTYSQGDEFPLFDVIVILENIQDKKYIQHLPINIIFSFLRNSEIIEGTVEFNSVRYHRESIERMVLHFLHILAGVLFNVGIKVAAVDFLTPQEKERLIFEFNDTAAKYPEDKTLPSLFEEQVEKTQDSVALLCDAEQLTYRQWNEKANRLARVLKARGIKPDTIAATMLLSSLELAIGLLGILKSGGAYLPLDPWYPRDRLRYMLQDCLVELVITAASMAEELTDICSGLKKVYTHDDLDDSFPGTNPGPENRPGNLVYVIYTSGSTGRPKGVLVEHKSVVNTLVYRKEAYKLNADAICLQLFSYAFDGFVTSFFTPLVSGAKVIILNHNHAKDITKIVEAIVNNIVTHFISIPTLFQSIIRWLSPREAANLKVVTLAGEMLSPDVPAMTKNKNDKIEIVNEYGVTEAAVLSTIYRNQQKEKEIKIGRPIWNTAVYIKGEYNRLNPVGLYGEMCIGGIGLARGYLNNPELTSEKFIENHCQPGKRIFRSGDLARWSSSGDIELGGRIDYQVKIRGFRIELGEIKNKLSQHKDVKDVVVTTKEKKEGDQFICAYIVTRNAAKTGEDFDAGKFRDYLAGELPGYMIPAYFINIEKVPLTHNGKVDTKALPYPLEISPTLSENYIPPKNEIEKDLVEIWQKVLGRAVGTNENFFMIGGDSIKSIQIIARMNNKGYKLEMRNLFQKPTIADLAPLVEKMERTADQSTITGTIPLTPVQSEFFSENRNSPHHFNMAVMLYAKEKFDEEAIRQVFTKIQEHHDSLRMTYKKENGKILQTNHGLNYPFSLQTWDFRNQENENSMETLEAKANEIQASIDLEKGPLMKLGLFHLDDGDRLLVVIHHLVIDGISWRIIFEDIEHLMKQYKNGEPLALPLKSDSFKLWAEKLTEYADSPALLKEKNYWAELESAVIPKIEKDFQEDNYLKDTNSFSFTLSEEETQRLLTKVNDAFGTEINDILLTALAMGVKRAFAHHRVLIALEGHGREEIIESMNTSRTVGWFTSTYPVILDVSYENDLARQIKHIKETLRNIPNNGIGYGIFRYLTSEKHKKEIDFKLKPQIALNYLGQFDAEVQNTSFAVVTEQTGSSRDNKDKTMYELDLSGIITNKQFIMNIIYSKKQFKAETIQTLTSHFQSELSRVIEFCAAREQRELTPSDFTYSGLSIETVDWLCGQFTGQIQNIYPLTPMQEGMLFHALYDTSSAAYFEQTSYRLHGEFDTELMEKSLKELFKRHDILRTAFIYEDIEFPVQVVLKNREADFYYEDLRAIPQQQGKDKERYPAKFKEKDRERYFDLSNDVLMRISVLQLSKSEYELIWSFHHVLMDGWCVGLLNEEFFEIYNSFLTNRPYQLPMVIHYRNYIRWLQKQDRQRAREYWRQYLEAYDEVAPVPQMGIPGAGPAEAYKRTEINFDLEKEKNHRLLQIAAKNHVTLNIITQSIWGIILGKYNGKTDVVFGSIVSGRPFELEGIETMVGLFINAIPVRIAFDPKTKFNRLLQKIQQQALDSEPYHYHPLAEIQAESPLKQHLINHLYIFENQPVAQQIEQIEEYGEKSEEADGTSTANKVLKLRLSNVEVFEQTNYNFNLELGFVGDRLVVRFLFNSNVYHPTFVERIVNHFKQAVEQVSANEEVEIGRVTLLSEKEKGQILFEFNKTKTTMVRDKSYSQLFENQVSRVPDRIAAGFHRQHITYRHLNDTANSIAYYLSEHGVTTDSIVPLFLPRSISMLASIIGVFKVGAAYLPLETDYPKTRIQFILENSEAPIIITASPHLETLREFRPSLPQLQDILSLDTDDPQASQKNVSETPLPFTAAPDHLAYMIYTSGTTGKPKGVMIHQLGMINHLYAKINDLAITAEDRIAQTASACFDISVWQFLSGLLVGGAVLIIDKETVLEPESFLQMIQEEMVTVLESVPSMMIAFLEAAANKTGKELPYLRWMVPTGEALTVPLVREWFRHYPGIPLVNAYGPTEAADDVTHYFIKSIPPETQRSIPIGKPLQNLHVYILDENLSLCPIGVRGEICVAGIGVGKGYWQDTPKTRQAFVPNPFLEEIEDDDYAVIYRTGDIGYMREDGNVECLGRMDFQVKIRGNRTELGEIESQLLLHHDIKETVVTVVPGTGAGIDDKEPAYKYLCAHYVSEQEIEATVLREYLSKELPDYMVPSYFVWLGKIPLTPNGKVDRQALPQPQPGEAGDKYIAPRDPLEDILASIWSEVLGMEKDKISIDADFFQLGGHSLKATRLISRIHRELNVRVPIAELFRIPTINKLAACIRKAEKEEFLLIVPGEKKEYYPLTSAQTRLYLTQQMQEDTIAYNMNDVFVSPVLLDKDRLEEIFAKLVQRHETLRTSIREVSGEPVQEIHKTVDFHVEYYEVNQLGEEAETIMKNFQRPFDLSRAPLLRVGIIKAHQRHVLMVDMHHIISDGVSQEVLAQDFTALYTGEPLPELQIHYKDFSQCQKQMVESGEMKRQEAFWLKEFAVEIPDVVIPADYPRPEFLTFAGDSVIFDIGAEEAERLRELANQEGATMFMMLLAIYNVLLSKLSGKEDIIVGTGTAGRRHADLERVIGMFVNTIVLRNYPFPAITFRDFVKEVKERTLHAFENQDYLLEDLVEKVTPHREMNRSPLFDTALVMENIQTPAQTTQTTQTTVQANETAAPPLALNRYEFEHKTAIFDISIFCVEIEDKLGFNVNYRTSLFKKETIEMYINYFKEIAAIVMADMDIKIEDIRFSSDLGDITVDILEKDQGDFGF